MTNSNLHDLLYCLETASLAVGTSIATIDLRAESVELLASLLADDPDNAALKRSTLQAVEDLRTAIAQSVPSVKECHSQLEKLLKEVPTYWNSSDRPEPVKGMNERVENAKQ